MDIRRAITTRWQRLRNGAGLLSGELPPSASQGPGVAPFGDATPPAGTTQTPTEIAARLARNGLGDLVHSSWKAFFSRFREDEKEFELPNYLEASTAVRDQLAQLGPDKPPDYATCRLMP